MRKISFSVKLMESVSHSHGSVMMKKTAKMLPMNINNAVSIYMFMLYFYTGCAKEFTVFKHIENSHR